MVLLHAGCVTSLVPRPIPSCGETAWYRLFVHVQEFRLFYGYFTVCFTTNDGQNPVLWTRHSTPHCNLNTKFEYKAVS